MQNRKPQKMYERSDSSVAQRLVLAMSGAACVAIAWWLLVGGGLETCAHIFGRTWEPGDEVRRICLAVALSIYYIRLLFTWFVFLKRGLAWSEVLAIAPWLLCIFAVLAIAGGRNASRAGFVFGVGVMLFGIGSWMNSHAEYTRHKWKLRPENRGQLYTKGLFRYTRHPNYLGDLLSFSGLCLIAGVWWTMFIPLLMLAGFVFVNIPALDAHLSKHYGATFDEYAAHTNKLIPFIY